MSRKRYDRAILVELECGCDAKLFTGRYRVSADLAGCLVMDSVRRGVWCHKHGGNMLPMKAKGVVRMSGIPMS